MRNLSTTIFIFFTAFFSGGSGRNWVKRKRGPDRERRWPKVCCTFCGGELFDGDRYWQVNGLRCCERCLAALAKAEFAACLRICGEEEGL